MSVMLSDVRQSDTVDAYLVADTGTMCRLSCDHLSATRVIVGRSYRRHYFDMYT